MGAAITSERGDILGVGTNDVPKPGGGLYWPDQPDYRDHVLGKDSNDEQRDKIVQRLLDAVESLDQKRLAAIAAMIEASEAIVSNRDALLKRIQETLGAADLLPDSLKSPFRGRLDITEYGRAVHAEMDALLSCARSGVSPAGALFYVTTFPCHNCTRHIIAAGIKRVYYIEPYGKSRAEELHSDAIVVEEKLERKHGRNRRVPFTHFVGIGPRRYFDLFSLTLGRGHELIRKKGGGIIDFETTRAWARVPLSPYSYLQKEEIAVEQFDSIYSKQLDMFEDEE